MTRHESAFVLHKAEHVAEALIRNLALVDRAGPVREWLCPIDAMVIGAGHTLPDRIDEDRGTLTIAVNSAIPALLHRGYVPHAVLCRESIDMSEQIRLLPKGECDAILDLAASHQTWLTCLEHCRRVYWFTSASTQTFGLAASQGIEPLYAGTSNVTAAVAVAETLGASRIDLVGCSRAFSKDGRAYAEGSPWASQRLAEVDQVQLEEGGPVDHYVGHIVGLEAKERMHAASGQRAPLRRERVVPVVGMDGERLWSLETLEGDREWLATFATRHPEMSLYQHAPDVAIAGWGHAPAKEPIPTPSHSLRAEIDLVREIERATLAGERVTQLPGILDGSPLVDFLAAAERLRTMKRLKGRPPQETVPAMLRVATETANRVEGWSVASGPVTE